MKGGYSLGRSQRRRLEIDWGEADEEASGRHGAAGAVIALALRRTARLFDSVARVVKAA